MGANAQTTVPTFTTGQVLTATQMNDSARTGVPVFATTVERDAAFGGSGEKTLAEGQLCYLESTNVVQYYDGATWATVGPVSASGLTLISSTTIGSAVASVTVSSAFSSTYDNYKIIISGGTCSTSTGLNMQLGSTTTGYYGAQSYVTYSSGSTATDGRNNQASYINMGSARPNFLHLDVDLLMPNAASRTIYNGWYINEAQGGYSVGVLDNTTSYTAFTVSPGSGTITGGTIRVYGYQNS
jgi:hypothetical protein